MLGSIIFSLNYFSEIYILTWGLFFSACLLSSSSFVELQLVFTMFRSYLYIITHKQYARCVSLIPLVSFFFLVNSTFLADISAILYQGICVCWSLSATSQYLYNNSHALSLALWFIILNHISLPLVDFVLLFSATSQYFSYMHSVWLMIVIRIRHTNNCISYLFTSICRCQIIWKHLNVGLQV